MDGKELKMRRKRLGLIQRHLAILLGVTELTVWKWENDKVRIAERFEPALEIIDIRLNKRKNGAA
jgi:transcriptional regulator with XRE-family HTH domain